MRIRLTILIFFLILILSVVLILKVFYSGHMLDSTAAQLKYQDEILSAAIASGAATTESTCNATIVHLNGTFLHNGRTGYPQITTAVQKIIYRYMINTFTVFRDAVQIGIVWDNGTYFYKSFDENYHMSSGWTGLIQELDALSVTRDGHWLTNIRADCALQGSGLYFAKLYTDINTGKRLGYIVIKLPDNFKVLDVSAGNKTFYLFDHEDKLLQTTDRGAHGKIILGALDDGDYRLLSHNLKSELTRGIGYTGSKFINAAKLQNGWTLVSVSDLRGEAESLSDTVTYILIAISLTLMLMFAMVNLTEQVHEEKRRQKQLEFALLQAQIKPHFLYNTLDTIYCLSCMERTAEASHVTKLLSDYYRLALSRGLEEIKLGEELEAVKKYIEIQTVRYRGILSYEVDASPEVLDIKIPKLTMQPLVENAIYHGIKPSGKPGRIKILAARNGSALEIRVTDDGVGMTEEQFNNALKQGSGGIGLRNVRERLRLYYGDKCEFLRERQSPGTSILIRIQTGLVVSKSEHHGFGHCPPMHPEKKV